MKMMKCDPRAFARCPYSKECSDSPEHTSFYKGTECDYFNQQVIHAPLTNADRIRAMSDEELAQMLNRADCPPNTSCNDGQRCIKCWMEWLQYPCEGE